MAFVHLHAMSTYSVLDAVMTPATYAKALRSCGQTAGALTESGHLCSLVTWMEAAKKEGIHPIYGATIWVDPPVKDPETFRPDLETGGSLVLLIEDQGGFEALSGLISQSTQCMWGRPRVPADALLAAARPGLRALSPMDHGVARVQPNLAVSLALAFGEDRWALEVFDWGTEVDALLRAQTLECAARRGWAVCGTNAARYVHPRDAATLEVLHATATGRMLDKMGPHRNKTDQAWVLDEAEIRARLGDTPCDHTQTWASTLTWTPKTGTFHFPQSDPPADQTHEQRWAWLLAWFPPPRVFPSPWAPPLPSPEDLPWLGEAPTMLDLYFAVYALEGLHSRARAGQVPDLDAYRLRLQEEIRLIRTMGFSAYMLVVAEFINWAKDHGIAVGPGRGSVAGSLVAWALRITEVDSIRFNLLFERFLNPARVSMPDVDVDFSQARREEVITHVRERYGNDHVGQICSFGTYGPKSALKDMLRALAVPFDDANRFSGLLDDEAPTARGALAGADPKLAARRTLDPVLLRALHYLPSLCGDPPPDAGPKVKSDPLLRQRGVHAAGVVISPRPLWCYTPVHRDLDSGRDVLGTDMHGVDALGLIKFDFLGLKTLDILDEALDTIEAQTGTRPDLDTIPLDDPAVFRLLQEGDVLELFQVESSGMQDLLRRLRPDSIEDIIAVLALYRPGPLKSGMVDDFVERKRGRQPIEEIHPSITPVLAPTYGVIVYQEQAMEISRQLSGFSLAEADLLRRAIGKKKPDEMAAQEVKFVEGAVQRGVDRAIAQHVYDLIKGFAEYSFNRSHSASYGLITYRTAWLKAHHRAAFLAAACTWNASDHATLAIYLDDAQRGGIHVLPPDINRSLARFTVEGDAVRYGLGALKGVGSAALTTLHHALEEGGAFTSLEDFVVRTEAAGGGVNKTVRRVLCEAGALDALGPRRDAIALWLTQRSEKKTKKPKKVTKKNEPPSLFPGLAPPEEDLVGPLDPFPIPSEREAWSLTERLEREHKVLGCWISGHPLDRDQDLAPRVATTHIRDLVHTPARKPVDLVGAVQKIHRIKTRSGDAMTFVLMADRTGSTEVTLFPSVYARAKPHLEVGRTVRIRGALDRPGAEGKILVTDAESIDAMRLRMARTLRLSLEGAGLERPERRDELLRLLRQARGTCPVRCTRTARLPSPVPTWTAAMLLEQPPSTWPSLLPPGALQRTLLRCLDLAAHPKTPPAERSLACALVDRSLLALSPADTPPPPFVDEAWIHDVEALRVSPDRTLLDTLERFYGRPGGARAIP